jgi:hypothetical protein
MQPGLAFYLVTDLGFAVGIATHDVPRIGSLVWIGEPIFDEQPAAIDVQRVDRWRWPVFFPLAAALRRKVVSSVGVVPIPPALETSQH